MAAIDAMVWLSFFNYCYSCIFNIWYNTSAQEILAMLIYPKQGIFSSKILCSLKKQKCMHSLREKKYKSLSLKDDFI